MEKKMLNDLKAADAASPFAEDRDLYGTLEVYAETLDEETLLFESLAAIAAFRGAAEVRALDGAALALEAHALRVSSAATAHWDAHNKRGAPCAAAIAFDEEARLFAKAAVLVRALVTGNAGESPPSKTESP